MKCLASVVDHVNARGFDGMTQMRNASTDIVSQKVDELLYKYGL